MSIAQKSMAFIAVIAVAVAIVFSFVATINVAQAAGMTSTQISSIVSLLQSFGADAATIANVQASLNGLPTSGSGSMSGGSMMSGSCTFTRDLTLGAKGEDVTCLQNALIANGHAIAAGATGYFGAQTQAAVMKWQAAAGVTPAAGYFGAKSRAAYASMMSTGSTGSTGGTTTVPAGTGLTVMAGSQPTNALAPEGASRVPFTRITLTAGNDGDVVVNSVQVQRTGLGSDAAFSGVVLVDEATGMQVGIAKTFNSNHQAAVGQAMTIPRGTSKTFLIAANMQTTLDSYSGEAPSLSVVGVNTTATVSGTMPIVGATHVINSTLSVGSVSLDVSSAFASNANATKEIGTTAHKFTGFRLTAGSSEDVRVRSIMFNQAGSVSASDLANVAIVVGGTSYPAMLSADGRYYTATLGSGVVVAKGNQVEVYIQADIVGSNASGRTVIFDVDKTTDIYATGETYGYGISPTTAGGSSVPALRTTTGLTTETTGTPYVYAAQVTVSGASVTTIAKANEVAAQNIAINVPNQPLGGYVVDIRGENMSVQSSVFTIASSSGSAGAAGVLTNVTLVDENGTVVAGPVDATCTTSACTGQTVTFTDTITYKTGRHVFTLRGKVASNVSNGVTYVVTTVPSSGWTTVRGETTGNTISLSALGSFAMNTVTVKAGSMLVNLSTSPASQTIVPGGQGQLFTNVQFDATQSGEDIRFSTAALTLTFASGAAVTDLTSCQLFDGTTAVNTGSNSLNPAGSSGATQTFTLDNPVTVTKGSVKTLGLKCNVSGAAANTGTYVWAPVTGPTFSGATSGTTITATYPTAPTITVTIGAGSFTVSTDASSPSYTLAAAGSTGITNGVYKFRASNENINLTRIGLKLTNTASSSAGDVLKASIYEGATKVGEAYFIGSAVNATSTLSTPIVLTRDVDKVVTIKLDYADVGTSQSITFSGHLVAVNIDVGGNNTEGTGASSGTTFSATGSTSVAGTRVLKSFPTLAVDTLSSTGVADGRLMRFKVTADAKGPIGIGQFGLNIATTTASVTNVTVYAFTDSNYSNPVSGVAADGNLQQVNDAVVSNDPFASGQATTSIGVANSSGATAVQVPAGSTLYFEVRASVSGVTTGSSVTTKLLGASSFPATSAGVAANPLLTLTNVNGVSPTTHFIWSPNTTGSALVTDQDWTNGFGVTGLPSGGLIQTRSN